MRNKIGLDERASLEVDNESNQLYWKGKPVKTVERVSFGWLGNSGKTDPLPFAKLS